MLSLITFLPLIGALLVALMPSGQKTVIKGIALASSVATLVLAIVVFKNFHNHDLHFQLMESHPWIPQLGISYQLGVDGVSLPMVLATALLGVVAVVYSFSEGQKLREFMALLLLLETSMLGTFLALDLILFYVFFEVGLFPLVLLTLLWGGERRAKASMRIFLYLFGGAILMLVGIVWIAVQNSKFGGLTFSLLDIQHNAANGHLWAGALAAEPFVFWAFALAFLIKSPAFPFHTWLVDGYTEAPIGAVLLGVLIKTGTYGLIRFNLTLFPDTLPSAAPAILTLAVIGIIYGAAVAAVQTDIRRLIAYSSVAHIGFILLGAFSLSYDGVMGAVLGQFNHAIATGALILLIGYMMLRKKSTDIRQYGGLRTQMPMLATLFLLATLAAVGLPGTNAFVSEFLSLAGSFESGFGHMGNLSLVFAVVGASGVILSAVYMLIAYMRVFNGPIEHGDLLRFKDLKPAEVGLTSVLILVIFWGGIYPKTFTDPMQVSSNATKMMGLAAPTTRPAWDNENLRIDKRLNLVSTRSGVRGLIEPADLHPGNSILQPQGIPSKKPKNKPGAGGG